jgi:amino-acid N-acetyltransferase
MLPAMEIQEWLSTFWVLEKDGGLVGCAGTERYGEAIVLRSVAVDPSLRGTGEGERLVGHALHDARRGGAKRAYLFTGSAAGFFTRFGFERCELTDFESAARESWQWRGVSSQESLRAFITPMRADL